MTRHSTSAVQPCDRYRPPPTNHACCFACPSPLLSAIVLLISPTLGIGFIVLLLVAGGIDLILLRHREVFVSEIKIVASFDAPRARGPALHKMTT